MFRSIGVKDHLVDRIVNELQCQIFDGGLRPGTLLPSEQELCEQMGVSRTPLREAVRMLVTKGLLETRPGVGTIVKQIRSNQISESISFMLNQDKDLTLVHLHNVRQMLEVENARLAAEFATSENIRHLHAINQEMRVAVDDIERFSMLDAEFHRTLAVSTQNPLLAILLDSIRDIFLDILAHIQNYTHQMEVTLPDHARIITQLEERNPAGAAMAMQAHLNHTLTFLHEILVQYDVQN